MKLFFIVLFGMLLGLARLQAETIPPTPSHYFNDYAEIISDDTEKQLDAKLEQLEKDTTAQVVVAIYPKMETESSIEDYTLRLAQKWGVGQKGKDNGAVLFVFIQDRKMHLQVGYGLEEKIPDALAKQIIEYEIKPEFKKGNYTLGLQKGVDAILKTMGGNYQPENPLHKSFQAIISGLTLGQKIIVISFYLMTLGGALAAVCYFAYWAIRMLNEIGKELTLFKSPKVFASSSNN